MVCPKCNSQYDDVLAVCPFCSAAEQAPQQGAFQVPQGAAEFAPPAPAKKKKTGAIVSAIIAVVVAIVGIFGVISSNKESTHVFYKETSEEGFDMSMEYTLFCKGDNVETIQWFIVYDFDDITEDYIDLAVDTIVDSFEDEYGEYDFIEVSGEANGELVEVTITFNDIQENIDTYVDLEIAEDGAKSVSYKASKENLLEDGFELVEE